VGEVDFLTIQYLSRDQILTEARDIYMRWPDLERDEKRRIIENTVDKITIGKDDISIELAYFPSSLEFMTDRQRGDKGSSPPRA
jgi:site-specific DNA recombinase